MLPENVPLERIVAAALLRNASHSSLGRLCDTIGGRVAGSAAGVAAEEWAAAEFRDIGLEPYFEPFEIEAWERGTLEAVAEGSKPWRLTAAAHGNTPRSSSLRAKVVDLGFGEAEDFERCAETLPGCLALCDEGVRSGHRPLHRSEKLALAVRFRAAGLLIASSAPGNLPRTGMCADREAPILSLGISLEDAARLRRLLDTREQPHVRIEMTNRIRVATVRNVLADIPGAGSEAVVVLAGAHLDSWDLSQGATDNGLGCAIVLGMAKALAEQLPKPRRTLRFALWAAEEVGLLGSKHHVQRHHAELDRVCAVLNFDMTGTPYGFWVPGEQEPPRLLRELASRLEGLGMNPQAFDFQPGLHSDHQPFLLEGVPVVGLLARLEGDGGRYYHAIGDTFEKVSKSGLCHAVAVGASCMATLSEAPERTMARRSHEHVVEMLRKADLLEALRVEGWVP
ncbi:MAG: M20/M25/M40 family metallo-hydrolase [Fimbriimonadales bacterium]|nr:M20/M25/M40 family metallo-hydrolase [Fimbriimonadales bacterium]